MSLFGKNDKSRDEGGSGSGAEARGPVAPGVEPIFYEFSSGCPRLLNLLADRVLLSAYATQEKPVPPSLVELKAKEITVAQTDPFSTTRAQHAPQARED